MSNNEPHPDSTQPPLRPAAQASLRNRIGRFFADYTWFILKNLIGWLLILSSFVVGPALPGPGGIPLFLIGFALVTFPGKRRLTARVLRGKPFRLRSRRLTMVGLPVSLALAALLLRIFEARLASLVDLPTRDRPVALLLACLAGAVLLWATAYLLLRATNWLVRNVPRARRRVRPWLRRKGIHLLPPRYHKRPSLLHQPQHRLPPDEILEFHPRHHERLRALGQWIKPRLRRLIGLVLVAAIFFWILRPIVRQWPSIERQLGQMSPARFFLAAGMFSAFLFVFRATSWRWILRGLGKPLLLRPATRIWCASELARYVPGVIWQVVGRVYLSRPYGVSTSISSVSQVLELVIFLLANILLAATCLLWVGVGRISADARPYLYGVMAMVPVLLLALHPRIFYPSMNRILRWFHKPPMEQRLSGKALIGLVVWAILGLIWQSLAIWVLVQPWLDLSLGDLWVVAGAYCLAWSAGFTFGSITPGGIGVREAVFIGTMHLVLPAPGAHFATDAAARDAVLKFLSVLLRLWATTGELTLAALAHLADLRGALGRPDAPGRVPEAGPAPQVSQAGPR